MMKGVEEVHCVYREKGVGQGDDVIENSYQTDDVHN